MRKLMIFWILFSLLFLTSVSADATYIQGRMYVSESGQVLFDLEADHFDSALEGVTFNNGKIRGDTEELINKNGKFWELSFDFGEYDNILVDIYFPSGLERIVSLSGARSAINLRERSISIYDSGRFDFSAEYSLHKSNDYSWVYWVLLILFIAGGYFIYKLFRRRKERIEGSFSYLSANEQKILESVIDNKVRQKELRETLGFPKASFTRYLLNLEKKRLIVREGEGKNKWVKAR